MENKKIHVLSKDVADKIAAGEVAERPSSVVKELVENSIDSGASKITVEIRNGGIKLIRIVDNGNGIEKDQVKTAFLRHATSKISSADDLYNISTMGFRGEALSSICAVAKVEVITKTVEQEIGTYYVIDHGVPGECAEIACADGTTMVISDLFANVPARMKFLKRDSTEAGYISDLMTKLALSKPDIAFEYICDDKQIFNTSGDGDIKNVILRVYGLKYAKSVDIVDYYEDGVYVNGVIGRPEIAFGNRKKQTVFINGRYVKSHVVAKVAEEAFRNAMMVGKFPFFVLDIQMPPELVDVNVHPAKTEVKFANEKQLYDIVYHAIKNAMYGTAPKLKTEKQNMEPITVSKSVFGTKNLPKLEDPIRYNKEVVDKYIEYTKPKVDAPKVEILEDVRQNENLSAPKTGGIDLDDFFEFDKSEENSETKSQDVTQSNSFSAQNRENQIDTELNKSFETSNLLEYRSSDTVETRKQHSELEFKQETFDNLDISLEENIFKDSKVIGQVFDTYVIISSKETMYMIDQHAAHERDGFETLKENYFKGERMSQALLVPVIVDLSHTEYDAVMSNIDTFEKFGFDVSEFGVNTVIINGTPIISDDKGIRELFLEITEAVSYNIIHPVADFEEKALDMISCKKAIKANDKLSMSEMTEVVRIVEKLYSKGIRTCPHGRPIVVDFAKKDIEKMFKRIV